MDFTVRRLNFGSPAKDADDLDQDQAGVPTPKLLKARAHRAAAVKEARDVLAVLPGPGESLHCILTHRLDVADVLDCLLGKLGTCTTAAVCTLGYNRKN